MIDNKCFILKLRKMRRYGSSECRQKEDITVEFTGLACEDTHCIGIGLERLNMLEFYFKKV
jgi:hypothetical protein